jgi:hypothetical protein
MTIDDPTRLRVACFCGKAYCVKCNAEYHENTTCAKYQEWRKENADAETLTLQELLRDGYKRCPHCQAWIKRLDGCTAMTCTNCRQQFQWDTLDDNGARHHFQGKSELAADAKAAGELAAAVKNPKAAALYAQFNALELEEKNAFVKLMAAFLPKDGVFKAVAPPPRVYPLQQMQQMQQFVGGGVQVIGGGHIVGRQQPRQPPAYVPPPPPLPLAVIFTQARRSVRDERTPPEKYIRLLLRNMYNLSRGRYTQAEIIGEVHRRRRNPWTRGDLDQMVKHDINFIHTILTGRALPPSRKKDEMIDAVLAQQQQRAPAAADEEKKENDE